MRQMRSVVGVGLAVLIVTQAGCATKVAPPPRPSDELRGALGSVAVVAAPVRPERELSRPVPGKALSALVGMTAGFGVGLLSGAGCFVTAGYAAGLCVLALWTPGMMGAGVAEGIDKGMSIAEWKRGTAAIEAAAAEPEIQEMLRDALSLAAVDQASYRLAAGRLEDERRTAEGAVSYTHLRDEGVDTVLEVAVVTIALASAPDSSRPTSYGPAPSWEDLFHPSVKLTVKARARLVRAADDTELFTGIFQEESIPRPFGEWARDEAAAFREARDAALQALGRRIAEAVFPPAPAPAAGSPDREAEEAR